MRQTSISVITICLLFLAERMLSKFTRKDLEEMAKRMRATTNTPKESLKLKALAQSPSDDEETTSRMVFTRKRKTLSTPTKCSCLVGWTPPHHLVPFGGQTPPQDTVVIKEVGLMGSQLGCPFLPQGEPAARPEEITTHGPWWRLLIREAIR